MAVARSDLINLQNPGWVHCTNRCVRRAFLCGYDNYSQQDYEHRKAWVEHRLGRAAKAFCVETAAYSVMANHIHVVVRMQTKQTTSLTDEEVIDRWLMVYPGFRESHPETSTVQDRLPDPRQGQREKLLADPETIATCRQRLGDLSWFMRTITEPIARWANREDDVTGRFWEGRFHTHPILDLQALLATMVYVDLNPIRATVANRLEDSDFTSGQERLRALKSAADQSRCPADQITANHLRPHLDWIEPIAAITAWDSASQMGGWRESDYLQLLENTGHTIRTDKRGHLDPALSPVLSRLGLDPQKWIQHMGSPNAFCGTLGNPERRQQEARRRGRAYVRSSATLFEAAPPPPTS